MASTLLTPSIIAKEGLMQLDNNLVAAKMVYRAYESEFGETKIGDTLTIRRPVKYAVRTAPSRRCRMLRKARSDRDRHPARRRFALSDQGSHAHHRPLCRALPEASDDRAGKPGRSRHSCRCTNMCGTGSARPARRFRATSPSSKARSGSTKWLCLRRAHLACRPPTSTAWRRASPAFTCPMSPGLHWRSRSCRWSATATAIRRKTWSVIPWVTMRARR